MAKENKDLNEKAPKRQGVPLEGKNAKKIKDLKIELLKSPTKRGRIKKEIARLLTMANLTKPEEGKA